MPRLGDFGVDWSDDESRLFLESFAGPIRSPAATPKQQKMNCDLNIR